MTGQERVERNHAALQRRRSPWFLPVLRAVLWSLTGALPLVIAFSLVAFPLDEVDWLLWCAAVPAVLAVTVGVTDANTDVAARKAGYPGPYLLWLLGLWSACVGAGLLLGRAALSIRGSAEGFENRPTARLIMVGALLLLIGAAALVGAVILRARNASGADRARSIRLTGPRVPAVVTETTRNRGDNTTTLWNVTLRFDDSRGRPRWHTLVDHRRFPVGSRHWVRYDPRRPRRRSTIFVEWDGT